jgi:hypothetical protein
MLTGMIVGGLVVALAGVLQVSTARRRRRAWPATALLRQAMQGLTSSEALALRAEFGRSGVALPERRRPVGFL